MTAVRPPGATSACDTHASGWNGAIWLFVGEGLILPTGLLTVAYLTRRLGPEGYGLFTLAATLVVWIEFAVSAFCSRPTVRFVGAVDDPIDVAATAFRLRLVIDLLTTAALLVAAPAVAAFFGEPQMTWLIRLFALDIPLFGRARVQRDLLIGLGRHRRAGLGLTGRWILRLLLIVVLVESGLSLHGAVLGSIGASIVEALINRPGMRGALLRRSGFPVGRLLGYGVPLFLTSVLILLFNRLDLVLLKALGASTMDVGAYAASQNVALVIGILAMTLSPIILSSMSRHDAAGETELARGTLRTGVRIVALAGPPVALLAASATDIVPLLFGSGFDAGIPALSILSLAALGQCFWGIGGAALTAAGRPRSVLALTAPVPLLAFAAHLFAIPRFGVLGAASVNAVAIWLGAVGMIAAACRQWGVLPPAASLVRSAGVAAVVAVTALLWSTPGPWVLVELAGLTAAAGALLLALSELRVDELRWVWASFVLQRTGGRAPNAD